ncbi:MAG: septal ring lytic transglycosylase RlpA family protein, partial [Alphaproteobacteria bacterium]|nr:septal ring lytic transglycosylase RlpA family protein [Alphaproteobacteria bacterium]
MVRQKFSQISVVVCLCFLLAACSSGPETPEFCSLGKTVAPKKATSRPYQIKGVWYYPQPHFEYEEEGMASYYGGGDIFHGRPTATGERFDMNEVTAAHKTLPLPCVVKVVNLENGREIDVKVNDRGPFVEGRIIDLSRRTAQLLGFEKKGTAKVRVYTLVPQSLALHGIDPSSVMLVKASSPSLPPLVTEAPPPPAAVIMATSLPDVLFEEQEEAPLLAEVEPLPSPKKPKASASTGIFVDVGSYANQAEASALSHSLTQNMASPVQSVTNKGPQPYVVRVGPFPSLSQANL